MTFDELKKEEDNLRQTVTELPAEQRKQYYEIEQALIKDPDTYAALNYFFVAGLHHFYLRRPLYGLLNLMAMLIALFNINTFGGFIIIALILIELPQLFRSQYIVQKYNNQMMRNTLRFFT